MALTFLCRIWFVLKADSRALRVVPVLLRAVVKVVGRRLGTLLLGQLIQVVNRVVIESKSLCIALRWWKALFRWVVNVA